MCSRGVANWLTGYRIESLLEESYNERMHLLVFLKMIEPGPFMRLMVLGAQGSSLI
jgi:hypothetical protein